MKKAIIITGIICALAGQSAMSQRIVKLWEGAPPTSNGITEAENTDAEHWITNVSIPELTIYLPERSKANGKAVVICPGGGYSGLASHHEGTLLAQWLNTQGIAGIVLKYRMPNRHKEVPLDDAQQAIRYVRTHAAELGVDPQKIGIAGSSAGGHLASTASTHFTTSGVSSRPDFTILFYPVITMDIATHGGSRQNLLGDHPLQTDINIFSNETQVNNNTPPTLILLSDDDTVVPPENSIRYYRALQANGVKASMYIFPAGGHGWGMRESFEYHKQVTELMAAWLRSL